MFKLISQEVEKHYHIDAFLYDRKLKSLFFRKERIKIFDKAIMEFLNALPKDWETFLQKVILKIYRSSQIRLTLWEEAFSCLKHLKNDNIVIVLITNGNSDVQRNKLKLLNIEKMFDKIYISDLYHPPERKPSLKMFKDFLKDFKLKESEVFHIGDDDRLDGIVKTINVPFYKIRSKTDWIEFNKLINRDG
jgi:putative hydrolase of the HAD superfamily